jgi:hypothetical protein
MSSEATSVKNQQHGGDLLHGLQSTAHRPVVPSVKVLACGPRVDVAVERHRSFFQGPHARGFQLALSQLRKFSHRFALEGSQIS